MQLRQEFTRENALRFLLFGMVGGSGVLINTGILWALTQLGMHYLFAATIATEAAIISNFIGNHFLTFRGARKGLSIAQRFGRFQVVSLFTLVLTLGILWVFVHALGEELLLVWNLAAICITFVINFLLNKRFTWNETSKAWIVLALVLVASAAGASADLAATSQLGYHPDMHKQVVVYVGSYPQDQQTFSVVKSGGALAFSGPLERPTDYAGHPIDCQGGLPCLVGNFTDLKAAGTYHIDTSTGASTRSFPISSDVLASNVATLEEFFVAQRQQGSPYHPDLNGAQTPAFPAMADGSYIMMAYQAYLPLMRLGSAYRTDPSIFDSNMRKTILEYVDYLESLQGVQVHQRSDGVGVRIDDTMRIDGAFTPGAITQPTLHVYLDTQGHEHPQSPFPVTSLCDHDGTIDQSCVDYAAAIYRCQVGEICLNMSYAGKSATITHDPSDYSVAEGWYYDWSCKPDILMDEPLFQDRVDPCMIFLGPSSERESTVQERTIRTLLAYAQALPAIDDADHAKGQELFGRMLGTLEYIDTHYGSDADPASIGAALFLLYDYTGDETYLQRAHGLASQVSTTFIQSGHTDGVEFYWEEYIRHEDAIRAAGLAYPVGGDDPRSYFEGHEYLKYKNMGIKSIGANGERVYDEFRSGGFSISRSVLMEGLLASKTSELSPSAPSFVPLIADSQLAWINGMNGIQDGVSEQDRARIASYAFIQGIGIDNPKTFHSRMLLDSGHRTQTGGAVIGAKDTALWFKADDGKYYGLDGASTLLGVQFGALGNGYDGETPLADWQIGRPFANGKTTIPGWINGPFDITDDPDAILNYHDTPTTYEFTETSNEDVATAIELFASLDGRLNGKQRHAPPKFDGVTPDPANATLHVSSDPSGVLVSVDDVPIGTTDRKGDLSASILPGGHTVSCELAGHVPSAETIDAISGEVVEVPCVLATNDTASEVVLTIETGLAQATITIDDTLAGETDEAGSYSASVAPGTHSVSASLCGYRTNTTTIDAHNDTTLTLILAQDPSGCSDHTPQEQAFDMFETDSQDFTFGGSSVVWSVDGIQRGSGPSFTWTPGNLYTSNEKVATVRASSAEGSYTWNPTVHFVINPLFAADDCDDPRATATISVFTNNDKYVFSSMQAHVTTSGGSGGSVWYDLEPHTGSGNHEIEWKTDLSGLSYTQQLDAARGMLVNGSNVSFTFSPPRGHCAPWPTGGSSGGSSGGGSSGVDFVDRTFKLNESPSGKSLPDPELVYTMFTPDVAKIGDDETLRMDVKTGIGGSIDGVSAILRDVAGREHSLELDRVSGDESYGTWEGTYTILRSGKHELVSVTVSDGDRTFTIPAEDTSFYGVSEAVAQDEQLSVVYSVLDQDVVKNGTDVTFRMDARDFLGISDANIWVTNNRGASFVVPLERVRGDANYGTYEGTIPAFQPDTTFAVRNVTISNANASRSIPLKARTFYVQALPTEASAEQALASASIFSAQGMRRALGEPIFPTVIGFMLMVAVMAAVLIAYRLRSDEA